MHHLGPKRGTNELTASISLLAAMPTQPLQHLRNSSTVLGIEIGIDFVKEVKGSGIAFLDGEDESEGAERFLATGQLADFLLLVVLAIEGYGDADACVFFDFALLVARLCVVVVFVVFVVGHVAPGVAVGFAVDD